MFAFEFCMCDFFELWSLVVSLKFFSNMIGILLSVLDSAILLGESDEEHSEVIDVESQGYGQVSKNEGGGDRDRELEEQPRLDEF